MRRYTPIIIASVVLVSCSGGSGDANATGMDTCVFPSTALQDLTEPLVSVTGLAGPEAVRYDPVGDVFFVANFNGDGGERDANGFISRVTADGTIEALEFATGTAANPLHAPRGMFVQGDTLWAADVDGVHAFHRESGEQLGFVSFEGFEPGFLNDVAAGPDGSIYVTDTGRSRIYRLTGGQPSIAIEDTLLGQPNGITWDRANERFLLGPWGGRQTLRAWRPGTASIEMFAESEGGFFDGIEFVDGCVVVASQGDSSLHVVEGARTRRIVRLEGRPADIGVDTQRGRVAVPYISLNQVDIWQMPSPRVN